MAWDYEAHRAKLYEGCKGTLPRPFTGWYTADEIKLRDYLRARRAVWANHAAWEDFSLGWKLLGYAVTDPDWLWDYVHQDEAWRPSFRAAANLAAVLK